MAKADRSEAIKRPAATTRGGSPDAREGARRGATTDPAARLDELDALFGALGHRARRQILLTLWFRGGQMSAGDIAKRFHHAWPTTTRHLKVLEEAGLITHERKAQARLYSIDVKKLGAVTEWLTWFEKKGH